MSMIGFSILLQILILLYASSLISGFSGNKYDDVLRDYDKYQPPPTSNASAILVKARLIRLFLSMPVQDPEEALTLEGHFHFQWTDERLIPRGGHFFNMYKLDEIWSGVPSIAHLAGSKTLELGSSEEKRNSAIVISRGMVIGRSVLNFRTLKACRSDLSDWPYDTKQCNIYFISPAINGAIRVQYEPSLYLIPGETEEKTFKCHGWDIKNLNFLAEKNGSQISLSFNLKRNGAKHAPYYHLPTIANLLVSLSLFFLEPQSKERFVLLLLVTIIQFYYLLTMSLLAPRCHYYHRPKIEYFIEMTAIIILIQIFLVIFCQSITVTEYHPSFLSKLVSMVEMSRTLKTFFLLDVEPKVTNKLIEEEEEEEGSFLIESRNQTRKQWQIVSNLVHRITFYILLLFSSYLICIVI
ncbi:hypothetical protein LSTR_LSTR007557 [Laodelphax striatellus]|uniref:Neurotransmitter-gated ion-channel ligand-binding domain-containing protein n=1 Tax=Laodelphax striatellus TaxID=195883 RepID=A0A482XSA6_LAOST|nr:hypothetical protein LSTR_LSTR007557 [Laodelphax striatellus]